MVGGKITAVIACKMSPEYPVIFHCGRDLRHIAWRRVKAVWMARGGLQAEPETGNGPAVIIHDDGEPGTHRWATVMAHPEIQQGMIGLPEVIGLFGFVSVEEIVGGTVGLAARHGPA